MMILDRLDKETSTLHGEADADALDLLQATSAEPYRRYLARVYGFVFPLERALADTPQLARYLDPRRLHKHVLLQHDLQTLGMRTAEIDALPQCMSIPWFAAYHEALGWAYVIERSTLSHPRLYRHLGTRMPGEAAFATSYLKCYFSVGEMWRSFGEGIEESLERPGDADRVVTAARNAFRHLRRWRDTLDGRPMRQFTEESVLPSRKRRAEASGGVRLGGPALRVVENDE